MANDTLEKLLAKRDEMNAKIRRVLGRDRTRKRRQDTRRKIIAGALVLAEEDPAIKAWLTRTLDKLLTRDDDRVLFDLAPLPAKPTQPQAPAPQPPTPSSRGTTPPPAPKPPSFGKRPGA
jgi:hypothetical protein